MSKTPSSAQAGSSEVDETIEIDVDMTTPGSMSPYPVVPVSHDREHDTYHIALVVLGIFGLVLAYGMFKFDSLDDIKQFFAVVMQSFGHFIMLMLGFYFGSSKLPRKPAT